MTDELLYEVFKRLLGPVKPVGDSGRDIERLDNLKRMTNIMGMMHNDVSDIAFLYGGSHEHSVKEIAKAAQDYINSLKEE